MRKLFNKNKLKNIVDEKEWSFYRLSKESKIAQSTLSDIMTAKNKNPSANTLTKLATALGVSVDEFFDEDTSDTKLKEKNNINTQSETVEEFDEEIRAIARNMKNLSKDKRKLLGDLVKSMTELADEELNK